MNEASLSSRRPRRALAWGIALGVGAVVLRELVRPREEQAHFIDWDRVEENALRFCGEDRDPVITVDQRQAYEAAARDLVPVLEQALGRGSAATATSFYPALTPVGRRQWVRFNVRIFRQLFRPIENLERLIPGSLLLTIGRNTLTRYLGMMLGVLARRVLGQYDPALLLAEGPPRLEGAGNGDANSLILVEPNVQAWAAKDKLPLDELRRWLAMHEMAHAWEFRAHPWLQPYMEELLKQVLVGRFADGRRPNNWELIRTLTVGMGAQWKAISKIQAAMTVLEGFGNLVMDDIGRQALPHFALLERAYRRRQAERTPLERAFLKMTGLDMKMRQYVMGERFCRELREVGGSELLNRVWTGPDWLPTMAEIQRPSLWIERARRAA
jgi:coenzyme F420 biosynthesis associated uncharacterized protein